MNCCTSRCGWCGRCDDSLRNRPEPMDYPDCDHCHKTLGPLTGKISLQGVGVACSTGCMNHLTDKHARLMQRSA